MPQHSSPRKMGWVDGYLVLGFVVCIELAQFLSAERQASFADVLRGWGGVGGAWFLLLCCVGEKRKANQGRINRDEGDTGDRS